ncbi:MAG: hypothetical protein J6T23_04760 [Elusimicrobia bacterium]|nr:hypothetical protein [Elusimicrobiota bacterium]
MINKKLLVLSFLMFSVFLAVCVYADRNIVTTLNGSSFISDSGKGTNAYSFIGQPVVFATKEEKEVTSQSAFASLFYITQDPNITFENLTGNDEFNKIDVKLQVRINSKIGNITKIRYRIWQGDNPDWNVYNEETKERPYEGFDELSEVTFSTTVYFSKGEPINYFKVYAQVGGDDDSSVNGSTTTANYPKRWSEAYMVRISTELAGGVEIVSPDKFTGLATIDPKVETTNYSIDLTSATITLYEGKVEKEEDEASATSVYSVTVSSEKDEYGLYKKDEGKILYIHSDLANQVSSIPKALDNNKEYTLVIKSQNNDSTTIKRDYVVFKALSGGVADILTYPSPFNPNKEKIKIRYLLANRSNVTIRLYDKAGKVVCKLLDGEERSAGTHEEEWDGRNYAGETLATGAYIVEIIAGSDRRYTALAIVGK